MNKNHYFHFTLGPVQGFVSQARRTRDFWAGSFILSWLSAVAMKAVHTQYSDKKLEEVILFPAPDPEFMKWLIDSKEKDPNQKPTQGSIPNRFKALVDDNFKPELVTNAVQEAWKALADKVWDRDLKSFGQESKHYTIWKSQVESFWDIAWIITGDIEDSSALDRRKNWRTYTPSEEEGVKCFMMDGWQELSGVSSPKREDMNEFWNKVRGVDKEGQSIESEHNDKDKKTLFYDINEGEALCAIAFIKRRFSRHFDLVVKDFKASDQGFKINWVIKGWPVPDNVPSVTYMAAVHWLEQLLQEPRPNDAMLDGFHALAFDLTGKQYSEIHTNIKCLKVFKENLLLKKILALDGNVFFPTELENPRIFSKKNPKSIQQAQTLSALKTITQRAKELKAAQSKKLETITPFYAILLMDGDSLGEKMSNKDFQHPITKGLEEFTKKVPYIVYNKNGFLVYAGGDDVLAILPLEDALPCAVALREHYMNCFKAKPDEDRIAVDTTISAAIEFVHIHTPFTKVLKDSHKLLDDVAKDGSGRDALAVRVWKPGGLQIEWSQPWEIVLDKEGHAEVCNLAQKFKKNNQTTEDFSNKFLYKIRERFDLLNPPKDKEDKYTDFSVFNDETKAIQLMTMEYMNAYNKKELSYDTAKAVVTRLMKQCRPVKRDKNHPTNPENWLQVDIKDLNDSFIEKHQLSKDKNKAADKINKPTLEKFKIWEADAALLVRFLAQKGVDHS
ncbi:type III-B CRISPR-associated protein Cas10/Cmr2 [uncultured Thiothrix sp.]|uniref:type III-B CRISPR-associated protein Cas10/Cmr2 n=1 Tax=uncultured Thiothrix sp. TaxID=223185 RepID=UPI002631E21A|nr:type III-B CRISPR-associated protein Cas10/Cmr2 [uncultured Thiothrix sp.]